MTTPERDPTPSRDVQDVVVLGGGPAGCAAAILLARRGHAVSMIRPERPPAPGLAESIPPSARRVLEELGALDAVQAAGFHANRGNVVWWAGAAAHRETFGSARAGFHTDRGSLERVLVGIAEDAGVRIHHGASARDVGGAAGRWVVHCHDGGEGFELQARWLVDATRRRGILARDLRMPDRSTNTIALVCRWRREGGWSDEIAEHTVVESYDRGWAWSVPLSRELRCFTAMVDPRSDRLDDTAVDEMLDLELARTGHIGPLRAGATPVGHAWACPASLYTSEAFFQKGLLLVGDAGSFIDPLSSFGVKKALSSGWLAGIVVHTALVDPPMTKTCLSFFDAREKEVYRRYRAASATFFEAGAAAYGTSYWRMRADAAREAAGVARSTPDDAQRARSGAAKASYAGSPKGGTQGEVGGWEPYGDPDRIGVSVPEGQVRRAFEELKSRPRVAAALGGTVRTVLNPAIEGQRVVLQRQLATDRFPTGLRFVRGVDLVRLVEVVPDHGEVADGWTAYNAVAPPVTLPDYLTALSTAFAAGMLEHGDG